MHVFGKPDSEGVVTKVKTQADFLGAGTCDASQAPVSFAMGRNRCVACQRMLPTLGGTAIALLLAAVVMVEILVHLRYATLPKEWQLSLDTFRDKPIARGGTGKPYTRDEDACILHNVHGPTRMPWADMLPTRADQKYAAKNRYSKYLKKEVAGQIVSKQWNATTSSSAMHAEWEKTLDTCQDLQLPYLMRQSRSDKGGD